MRRLAWLPQVPTGLLGSLLLLLGATVLWWHPWQPRATATAARSPGADAASSVPGLLATTLPVGVVPPDGAAPADALPACGLAPWLPPGQALDASLERQVRSHAYHALMGRTLAQLRGGDERQQALGLYLDQSPAGVYGGGLGDCDGTEDCRVQLARVQAHLARREAGGELQRRALVDLGARSVDPAVVALAQSVCTDAGCSLELARRWTLVDAGNAAAWAALAGALRGGDDAAARDALSRVAQATRYEAPGQWLAQALLQAAPADARGLADLELRVGLLGAAMAAVPPLSGAVHLCRGNGGGDANLVQSCARLAELLLNGSRSLLDARLAVVMARESGLPEGRWVPLDAELGRLTKRQAADEAIPPAKLSDDPVAACAQSDRALRALNQQARLGELAALRSRYAALTP
jgi:hypothetical protein